MAKTFREMVAWQLAFELKDKVVALIAASPKASKDFKFRDQLTDAVKSVPSNIAEGFGRFRPRQSAQFVEVALGSLDETENHLRDGVSSGYFTAVSVGPLILLAARCRTATTRWLRYLRSAKPPGPKNSRPNRRKNRSGEPS